MFVKEMQGATKMQKRRYPIAKQIRLVCGLLGISEQRVLRRVGVSADMLDNEGRGVPARECFELWKAVYAEADRPDLIVYLGKAAAKGPFVPAIFSFACSRDIESGLARLALFKPLIAPVNLDLSRDDDSLSVRFTSSEPDASMPASMSAFEVVYFLECARNFTARDIKPLEVGLPDLSHVTEEMAAYLGAPVVEAPAASLKLRREDTRIPLVSEDTEFRLLVERELLAKLEAGERDGMISERVRAALLELLPAGQASVEAVCDRLMISRRSLQRHLQGEGKSFQTVLEATRAELAMTYLRRGDLSAEEISYLLAYRDPNSFYRAFHGWTGLTPAQARQAGFG